MILQLCESQRGSIRANKNTWENADTQSTDPGLDPGLPSACPHSPFLPPSLPHCVFGYFPRHSFTQLVADTSGCTHTWISPLYKLEIGAVKNKHTSLNSFRQSEKLFPKFSKYFSSFGVSCHIFFSNFPHFIKWKFRTLIKNNTPNFFFYIFTLNMDLRLMYIIIYWSYEEEVIHWLWHA